MRSRIGIGLFVAALLTACGGNGPSETAADPDPSKSTSSSEGCPQDYAGSELYPIFVSSEVVKGDNRFLLGLLDSNDAPIAAREIEVSASFSSVGETGEPIDPSSFSFIETDPRSGRGLYVTQVAFPSTGVWAADVSVSGGGYDTDVRGCFEVAETSMTPAIGAPAPSTDTPTADEVKDLSEISTDDDPLPRFYEVSIPDALKEREPFVITFATPKYCSSQVCGPTLDIVKSVASDFPDTTFIHSEIYEGLEPNNPPLAAVTEWGLPSEPWVFVVDDKGRVAAKFEGTVSPKELRTALANVS